MVYNAKYTCHDIKTFKFDKMAWNIKNWISQERSKILPWNKNIHKVVPQWFTKFSEDFIFIGGNI